MYRYRPLPQEPSSPPPPLFFPFSPFRMPRRDACWQRIRRCAWERVTKDINSDSGAGRTSDGIVDASLPARIGYNYLQGASRVWKKRWAHRPLTGRRYAIIYPCLELQVPGTEFVAYHMSYQKRHWPLSSSNVQYLIGTYLGRYLVVGRHLGA